MTTETSTTEMVKEITSLKQPKEWGIGPSEITLTRPDGSNISLLFSHYIRTENILHSNKDQDDITYDFPADGDFNLILYAKEENNSIPLGAASIGVENGTPIVTMIQRIKSRKRRDPSPPNPNSLIKINATYDGVPHPKQDLLQGDNKIDWQQVLLDKCETIAKSQGYNRLRLRSGFVSKYVACGHNLPLAVQQYDCLVKNDKNWAPINEQNQQITNPEQELNRVIRRIRDKKIKTIDEVKLQYPNLQIPACWEKNI